MSDQTNNATKNDAIQNTTFEEASKVVAEKEQETIHDKDEEDRKIAEVEANVEGTQQITDNIANEMRTGETSNAQDFIVMQNEITQMKAAMNEMALNQSGQQTGTINQDAGKDDKLVTLSYIQKNFRGLVLDPTSPKLARCNKRYMDVKLDIPTSFLLTDTCDLETQVKLIQRTLISKQVVFSDWMYYVITLCDDAMETHLTNSRNNPLSWSDAMYELFGTVQFLSRDFAKLDSIMDAQPMNGENLLSFFQKLCQQARRINGFDVLPALCLRTKTLLTPYRGLFTDEVIRSINTVTELERFLSRSLLSTDTYQGNPKVSKTMDNSLFALDTDKHGGYSDRYYCRNCTCPKCKNGSHSLKPGYCVNCSCVKCINHSNNRKKGSYSKTNNRQHFRINQISNDQRNHDDEVEYPSDMFPEDFEFSEDDEINLENEKSSLNSEIHEEIEVPTYNLNAVRARPLQY